MSPSHPQESSHNRIFYMLQYLREIALKHSFVKSDEYKCPYLEQSGKKHTPDLHYTYLKQFNPHILLVYVLAMLYQHQEIYKSKPIDYYSIV